MQHHLLLTRPAASVTGCGNMRPPDHRASLDEPGEGAKAGTSVAFLARHRIADALSGLQCQLVQSTTNPS